jgi:hypothetical protein
LDFARSACKGLRAFLLFVSFLEAAWQENQVTYVKKSTTKCLQLARPTFIINLTIPVLKQHGARADAAVLDAQELDLHGSQEKLLNNSTLNLFSRKGNNHDD